MDGLRWGASYFLLLDFHLYPPILNAVQFSAALAAGVILNAVAKRPNFYSAAVYLSQSF